MSRASADYSSDCNFDQLADRFQRNIYDTAKGRIRLAVLWRDLNQHLLSQSKPPLSILDAASGHAVMAQQLAQQGHHLTLCDISHRLLSTAKQQFADAGLSPPSCLHQPLQDLGASHQQRYDLILCHAALEWIAEAPPALAALESYLKPGGYLSLMVFNQHGLTMSNVLKGNFEKVLEQRQVGYGTNLTPMYPRDPYTVEQWLTQLALEIRQRSGVRVFHDYLRQRNLDEQDWDDLLSLELSHCQRPPYLWLGRYIHFLAQKPPLE